MSRFDPEVGTVANPRPPVVARGHLRLAPPPSARRTRDGRLALLLRSALSALALALATVAGWVVAALALAPVVWRRAPVGRRATPIRAREARVIQLPRRAFPS